jgi:hypothetical protein
MPANTTPIFTLTPNASTCVISAANTARDGSGTLITAFTSGVNGSRIESVTFTSAQASAAANSAMVGRVFLTDTSGANPRLIAETTLPAVTASNTAIGQAQIITFTNGLIINSGQLLKVCQSVYAGVQDQFQVLIKGGDY